MGSCDTSFTIQTAFGFLIYLSTKYAALLVITIIPTMMSTLCHISRPSSARVKLFISNCLEMYTVLFSVRAPVWLQNVVVPSTEQLKNKNLHSTLTYIDIRVCKLLVGVPYRGACFQESDCLALPRSLTFYGKTGTNRVVTKKWP